MKTLGQGGKWIRMFLEAETFGKIVDYKGRERCKDQMFETWEDSGTIENNKNRKLKFNMW